ncbi:hypothetical protein H4R20_001321 [Coemansia guatemalensis]|uniref:Uncharacterized protein n=1 Tax=Coemansia guatemalensis TaxID=2761395 RepID=A0A9W8HXM0_9FUNG|nr:hypothetical protein H4R20_001321 [Coemansia guatemalensis]
MEISSDFEYESVVSDSEIYSGLFDSSTRGRSSTSKARRKGKSSRSSIDSTPAARPTFERRATTDSIPSLALSTPNTERFQLEYERERHNDPHFGSSQQSQNGPKSAVYSESTSDFSAKLRGDVVVSEKWSAVGRQQDPAPKADDLAKGDGGVSVAGHKDSSAPADDTTFEIPPFSESTDVTLSRLIRESSIDDQPKPSAIQGHHGREVTTAQGTIGGSIRNTSEQQQQQPSRHPTPPSAMSAPTNDVAANNPRDPHVTPKMSRTQSDNSGDGAVPAEARVLRSALRGSRSTPPVGSGVHFDDNVQASPRKVSFAGAQALSSPELSAIDENGTESAKNSITYALQTRTDARSQNESVNANVVGGAPKPQSDEEEPGDEYQPTEPQSQSGQEDVARLGIGGVGAVGVGMAGGMFRKFAGWSRNRLSSRSATPPPSALLVSAVDDGKESSRKEVPIGATTNSETLTGYKQDSTMGSLSSSQSASTVSPVKTEPMRSQLLSGATTPVSSNRGTSSSSSAYTTPRPQPASARRPSQTPSRSVNPLTRHLAIKAIRSAPPARRSMVDGSEMSSSNASPTSRGHTDSAKPLIDTTLDSSGHTTLEDSALLSLADLQRQFDGFASQLKHDASAVHADVRESEEAWYAMQHELQGLRAELLNAETARDFLQRQMADVDQERVEWEQERQQMIDDKSELQSSVDRWRQRIGDLESERNGAWNEGSQTREQLLHTIVQLEEELKAANERHREKYETWGSERQELLQHVDDLMAEYDRVDAENREIQTNYHDRLVELEDERAHSEYLQSELDRKADLETQVSELSSSNQLLKEALEDLTERNRELKQARDESHLFETAVGETMMQTSPKTSEKASPSEKQPSQQKPQSTSETEAIDKLRREHRDELDRVNHDYQVLLDTMENLNESKMRYKSENAELTTMAESARDEIEKLKRQLEQQQQGSGSSAELLRLQESEQELQRELDSIERERQGLIERTEVLADKNDELVQRVARLETELADMQPHSDRIEELHLKNTHLQKTVADMEKELLGKHQDNDDLRQSMAAKEAQLDDMQMELGRVRDDCNLQREAANAAQAKVASLQTRVVQGRVRPVPDTPSASTGGSPQLDQAAQLESREFELGQARRSVEASISSLEASIAQATQRRERLEKEKRLLADGLRDLLLNNATLRMELTEILLRRAGRLRDLQMLQRTESQSTDEAGASMVSGMLNNVPSTSQLLDGNSRFFNSLDKHLDEVANIIEDDDPPQQPVSAPTGRARKRMLTPIKEEAVAQDTYTHDTAIQCDINNAEEQCRALRAALASAKQERDQFRASHEEASESIARLSGQIEELSEHHERAKANRITTARIALRVHRQLAVLARALSRLTNQEPAAAADSQFDADDGEDALVLAEEDEMFNATLDRPLDAADCALLGLAHVSDTDPQAADVPDLLDRYGGEPGNDEALEEIAASIQRAYKDLKRVRWDLRRVRNERARLMRRLAEADSSRLPSYKLSTQWGRNMRSRSYAEGQDAPATGGAGGAESLLEDTDPPASLFLADESAVMAELAAAKRGSQAENGETKAGTLDASILRDPASAAAEVARLTIELRKKGRRLRVVEAELQRIEGYNRELTQLADRAIADRIRAQQESSAAVRRHSVRSASRITTPGRGTDWDDVDAIERELKHCAAKNRAYFESVDQLCRVLGRHTIDQALADGETAQHDAQDDAGSPIVCENVYRTLLIDMATMLDARGDLDERKSIRDNFRSMTAAVRRRLDNKDQELNRVQSELDVSRLAIETEAPAAEQRLRMAERRATELETQAADAQEQLTTQQANIRSLNASISRLRQQCVAAEADVQEARLERDGWHQQFLACEQTLSYQISENDRLSRSLEEMAQLNEQSMMQQQQQQSHANSASQNGTANWGHLKKEWVTAAREEAAESWRGREFELRQTYEAQIKILAWAVHTWGSILRAVAVEPAVLSSNPSSATSRGKALRQAVDELDTEVDRAVEKTNAMRKELSSTASADAASNRATLAGSLNQLVQSISNRFTTAWRDNVCQRIAALIADRAGQPPSANGKSLGSSPSGSASSSNSSNHPRISDEQKALIRSHYGQREEAVAAKHKQEKQALIAEFKREKQVLIAESRYLRGRVNIEVNKLKFVYYQKKCLLQLLGGQAGVFRRIDEMARQEADPKTRSRELVKARWRRVLLAVRMKNRLIEMARTAREVNAIKAKALSRMSLQDLQKPPLNENPKLRNQPASRAPPPPVDTVLENSDRARGTVFYNNLRFHPQQLIGLKSVPITPSRLRNRASDIDGSSTGSSF